MQAVRYGRVLASAVGISAVFVLAYLVVGTRASSPILTLVVAVGWTIFDGGLSLYYWRRGGPLETTNPVTVLGTLTGATGVLALWFLANCEFVGVSALDSRQWSKLWEFCPRSTFLLAVTSAGCVSTAVATFLRIGVLRLLGFLTARSGGSG